MSNRVKECRRKGEGVEKRVEKHIERIFNELENVHLVLCGNEQSLDTRKGRWDSGAGG